MKKPEYLKSMFEFCKNLGQFSQYENYEQYRQEKFGIDKKETPTDEYNTFLNEMGEKERSDYFEAFGKDE